jgi:hypothetical protein
MPISWKAHWLRMLTGCKRSEEVCESVDGGENRKARIIESRTLLNGACLHWSKGPPARAKT